MVGAGIAGLAAADALRDKGFQVIVLEARDRIGGRIHTVDGIDLGAHWIHSTEGNPIATLARRLNAETIFVGGDSTYTGGWDHLLLCADGHTLTDDQKLLSILVADEVRDRLDALRRQHAAASLPDLPYREAVRLAVAGMDLTDEARVAVEWHVALSARDDCAADLDSLSFVWWDDGYEVYGYGDSVFARGYEVLTRGLAAGLDIRLQHAVQEIQYGRTDGAPVRIVTGPRPHRRRSRHRHAPARRAEARKRHVHAVAAAVETECDRSRRHGRHDQDRGVVRRTVLGTTSVRLCPASRAGAGRVSHDGAEFVGHSSPACVGDYHRRHRGTHH